jgi:hypothetical protein
MKQCLVLDQNAGINLIRIPTLLQVIFIFCPPSFFYTSGSKKNNPGRLGVTCSGDAGAVA